MRRAVMILAVASGCLTSVFASCGKTSGVTSSDDSAEVTPSAGAPNEPGPPPKHPAYAGPPKDAGTRDAAGDTSDEGSGGAGGAAEHPAGDAGPPAYDPDDGVLHVWTLGDSITVGVNGGYRNDLYNLLTSDGLEVDMVGTQVDPSTEIADKDHEGHVAYTIANTIEDVDDWLDEITPPDVVLLWLGCNDFAWWTNLLPAEHADQFDDLVERLLEILPEQSKLVVGTIPPQSSKIIESVKLDRRDMADEFDELLRQRLPGHRLYGERVFLADIRAEIDLGDLYDGIHPTREAHATIAGIFHRVLSAELGM